MRVLVIGMADSVHLARWLAQFSESTYEFEIVSSSPHRKLHPVLTSLIGDHSNFKMSWASHYFSLLLWLADRLLQDWLRGALVALTARHFKPDLIHVCEFQNAGYAYIRSRAISRQVRRARLLLTPYGSDMYWFRQFPKHRKRLEALLAQGDVLSAECERDRVLATELGFTGSFGPLVPASGVISFGAPKLSYETRRTIAVKGYQNKWGRAKSALRALALCSDILHGYRIEVFSCNAATVRLGRKLRRDLGLDIVMHSKGSLGHDEMLELFERSKIFISLSRSDGLPSSLLESLSCGAVPIHSSTACIPEWLSSGQNGYFVEFDDEKAISQHIRELILDHQKCKLIATRNRSLLESNFDHNATFDAARRTYQLIEHKISSSDQANAFERNTER